MKEILVQYYTDSSFDAPERDRHIITPLSVAQPHLPNEFFCLQRTSWGASRLGGTQLW